MPIFTTDGAFVGALCRAALDVHCEMGEKNPVRGSKADPLVTAAVDRALARWSGVLSPAALDQLRERVHHVLATHPSGLQILDALTASPMVDQSGDRRGGDHLAAEAENVDGQSVGAQSPGHVKRRASGSDT